jgi:hypothetical protein
MSTASDHVRTLAANVQIDIDEVRASSTPYAEIEIVLLTDKHHELLLLADRIERDEPVTPVNASRPSMWRRLAAVINSLSS